MYSRICTIKQYTHIDDSRKVQKRVSDLLDRTDSLKLKTHYSNYRFEDAERTAQQALESVKASQHAIETYDNICLDDEDVEKIRENL